MVVILAVMSLVILSVILLTPGKKSCGVEKLKKCSRRPVILASHEGWKQRDTAS